MHLQRAKIILFNYSLEMGGTDRVAVELAKIFDENGHEVGFLTMKRVGQDFFTLPASIRRMSLDFCADDSKLTGAGYIGWSAFVSFWRMIRVLRVNRPDFLISNWTSVNCFALLASIFSSVKIVCVEHIHFDQPSSFWKILRRCLYRKAFKVVCLTESDLSSYLRLGVDVVKIDNPLTINVDNMASRNGKVFLAVGRLEHQKGFDILIKAFSVVFMEHPDATLRICGAGSEYDLLKNLIRKLKLESSVFLCGAVSDMSEYYSSSDYFVLSSRFEGFGLVIVEAQAHGLPVVSFDCPTGPADIITHEYNGLLASSGSVEALTQGMIRMIKQPELCQSIIKNGCSNLSRFSKEVVYKRWQESVFK